MSGRGNHRVVDADHRERADRPAFGAQLVKFRDALFQRTAGERDAERALLKRIVEGRTDGGGFFR